WSRLAWSGAIGYDPRVLAIYHAEVPGSATKSPESDAQYPAFVREYREWLGAGRIPARLERSSARFANWLLLRHAVELLHLGRRRAAWRVLRECRPDSASWPTYLGLPLRFLVPAAVGRGLRRPGAAGGTRAPPAGRPSLAPS